ncbi:collagen alpha-5(VI) chain [Biomphalaria pfeifferi]|uniref:Collagen alpha-5(VI) chain n=1 Tax=Biomphalaria pfeifferi TaxID=112525 RepID=A0AAD8B388_BIOPF|nr:collagen alpha-5(VI) chain [Biomphalaria pfeifferi]
MLVWILLHVSVIVIGVRTFYLSRECHEMVSDIVFLIDSSFSLHKDDFKSQLVFVKAMIDSFPIGNDRIQVGVVSIGASHHENIGLGEYNNNHELKIAVGDIKHLAELSRTHLALRHVHTNMFRPEHGGRPGAKHQIILISDGRSDDENATLLEASEARRKNIEIFSVGVGHSVNTFELRAVASEPKHSHVFKVDNFEALQSIIKTLVTSACHNNHDHEIQETVHECLDKAADVVFVLDGSSSMWVPDFLVLEKFVSNVSQSFDIAPNLTRVGVIAYSDTPIVVVNPNDIRTKADLHHHQKIPHISGNTNTAMALEAAWSKLLEEGKSNRPDAAQILILLTDGHSDDNDEALREAKYLHSKGVEVFVVALGGKTNSENLGHLANSGEYIFHVEKAKELPNIISQLTSRACHVMPSLGSSGMFAHCPQVTTDVVFIYDRNSVNGPHHDFILRTLNEVVSSSGLQSGDDLRFGVIRDAPRESESSSDIELTNQWTAAYFKNELDLDTKRAEIDLLLQKVRIRYFLPLTRVAQKKIVVLFVDSNLANNIGATLEAMRLKRSDVRIVVVTLGKHVDMKQIPKLASLPHSQYIIEIPFIHKHTIQHVTEKLIKILCD